MATGGGSVQPTSKYNTVNEMMTDICDKVREKTGITGTIKHSEIADKIASIKTAPDEITISTEYEGALKNSSDINTINSKLNEIATNIDENCKLFSLKNLLKNSTNKTSIDYDFSKFKSHIINANSMFYSVDATSIPNIKNLNTKNILDMSNMFSNASLTSLDLSGFDNSNCFDMSSMFEFLISMTSLTLTNFKTPTVQNMQRMFMNCRKITSLNLSSFNTSNVTNMSQMFCNNYALKTITGSLNTSKVTDMSSMFDTCRSLQSVNVSSFDTSSVTNMSKMFYNCVSLTSLNLTNFRGSYITSVDNMFGGCMKLATLDLGRFDTCCKSLNMFDTSTYQDIEFKMTGCVNFASMANDDAVLNLTKIWRGSDTTKIARFETFANSLGTLNNTYYLKTIKIHTDLYNVLSDEQKSLITNKKYTLAYGTY